MSNYYNLKAPLYNLVAGNKVSLKDETGKDTDIHTCVLIAMMQQSQQEQLQMADKVRRYRIGQQLCLPGDTLLTPEDVTMIKNTCGLFFSPMIVGQIIDFFDNYGLSKVKSE